ncbi:DNA polymerase III subunit alpha [Alloprevotella rava]|uniref:DNA polymerase III subunit alpha n=1 Tax=Alloprevotella rava TaxID=671218 RepID=A0A7W5UFS0_9BACT|nr:DNA polymerase III subunit alpha [Alloprevotella rava]MBB3701611.1 DNA polymerase-3 subunit alpha [Alloprevotella rava]
MEDFVHLHVHTQYSILDGQSSISALLKKAMKDGMRGMAITDHGNMMGIKDFFNTSKKEIKKAKDELAAAQAKMEALQAGIYKRPEEDPNAGMSDEELLKNIEAQMPLLERRANFKPIFGCEMYVARRSMTLKEGRQDQGGNHLIVLAKNEKGYHNLIKLVSKSWVDGFYMRPRTDHDELEKHHEGLIICSACIAGEVPSKALHDDFEGAEQAALWFKNIFGDDYYLELQRHEVKDKTINANKETFSLQQRANKALIDIAHKHNIKLVCTNDVHFVEEENAEAHDRLICLSTGRDLDDPKRMMYTKQEWFKTQREMNEIFCDIPEAIQNTCEICDKIETYSIDHSPIMPNFAIPESFGTEEEYRQRLTEEDLFKEFTRDENGNEIMSEEEGRKKIENLGGYDKLYRIKFEADYLAKISYEGAIARYGEPLSDVVKERINFELHIMKTMGFPGYFLIVQDYINAARKELNVSVGPGRGSAAGSCVAYCLGITQLDPIAYDLLFERFLNPDRISLPDIDVDFDDDGRGRVLDWVTQKYGEEKCAHIITYGTMATKLALKDVARVQKLPLAESNRLCKLIPDKLPEGPDGKSPKMNLDNCIKAIPELREAETSPNPLMRDTIRYARMLEGNVRNTGVHACGFIICRDKISDWVPISTAEDKQTGEKLHCTQYEGRVIEETGLIKMDFLGLKTLTIIKDTLENIHDSLGIEVDIEKIPLDDEETYALFSRGETIGTFQFESPGMQKYLRELQPNCIGDLIAMNALYRPGPIAYIPSFIKRKHGEEPITYDLPCMEKYLRDTYGITVYQEQVMLLSREIADFTRGESDTLRKAMGKKLIDKLNHMYPKFIKGGTKKGYEEKTLEKIWNDWRAFASYAFNKSHAACYAWIAYQTGYLKAHYPAQFMAGDMNSWLTNITTLTKLMDECKRLGIDTLGPDINESMMKFSVNHHSKIRFGLAAIKGCGEAAMKNIIAERKENGEFKDIYDFVERIDLSSCNKKNIENLAIAGAFDSFGIAREQFVEKGENGETFIDILVRYGQQFQMENNTAQNSLFGDFNAIEISKPMIPQGLPEWSNLEKLNKERDLIGIYISGHPLDNFKVIIEKVCTTRMPELEDVSALAKRDITLGGIVTNIRTGFTKKTGNPYGFVTIEDYSGSGEIAFWGEDWARWSGYMNIGNSVFITAFVGTKRYNQDEYEVQVRKVEFLGDVKDKIIQRINITIHLNRLDQSTAAELASIMSRDEGHTEVIFHVYDDETKMNVQLMSQSCFALVDTDLITFLEESPCLEYKIG